MILWKVKIFLKNKEKEKAKVRILANTYCWGRGVEWRYHGSRC